jgi:hypothetical protein
MIALALAFAAAVPAAASAAVPASGPGLAVSAEGGSTTAADGLRLAVTVTNRGSAPCAVVANPDGGLRVVSVTRDGEPVTPTTRMRVYLDGRQSALAADVRTLKPGESATFTVRAGAGTPLSSSTGSSASSALVDEYPVDRPGRYHVELRYASAAPAAATPCGGLSAAAGTDFAMASGRSTPIWWYAAAGVLLLLVAALVWWLVRRGRHRPAAAVYALLAVAGLLAVTPRTAHADITIPPPASSAFTDAVNGCLGQLRAYDPAGILAYYDSPSSPPVVIRPGARWQDDGADGEAGNPSADVTITWAPDRVGAFPSGTAYDPCSALEHELSHAYDFAHNQAADNEKECDSTGVDVGQVRAMLIENQIRARNGLPPHAYDGLNKIPTSLDKCDEPPPPGSHSPVIYPTCFGPQGPGLDSGGCGTTNGDPHLTTFDGRHYDFQTVGEFVAARGGDLQVQVRQTAAEGRRDVSVNTAVAVAAGPTRLGFYLAGDGLGVHRNGRALAVEPGDMALPGGATLTRRPSTVPGGGDGYTVAWSDGTLLWVDRIGWYGLVIHLKLAAARRGDMAGVLGDYDGDPRDDLAVGGTMLPEPAPAATLTGAYADSWRVTDATSLFDYASGESTATYTDTSFPDDPVAPSAASLDRARRACAAAGVTEAAAVADCVLDVSATGALEFAAATAASQRVTSAAGPTAPPTTQPTTGPTALPTVQPTAPPVTAGGTLRDGATVTGHIAAGAGADRYPLDLGGSKAFYVTDWDGPGSCDQTFSVNLVDVANGNFPCDGQTVRFEVPAASAGSARLEIAPAKAGGGDYSFRLVTEKIHALALTVGQVSDTSISQPGQVDVYTFSGGGHASVRITGTPTTCAHDIQFIVNDADDGTVTQGFRSLCGFDDTMTLPRPGDRYTITLHVPDFRAQAYTLKVG